MFAQALTGKFDAVGVVDKAIQHGVGDSGIPDHIVCFTIQFLPG